MENRTKNRLYRLEGGARLEGHVRVSGAKNAMTKEIVASIMSGGVCTFSNVPRIGDVDATIEIVQSIGARCTWTGPNTLEVDSTHLSTCTVPIAFSGVNRIPILLMGPLLHRMGEARVPVLGGCNIGKRPVDFHVDGLTALGANVELEDGYYVARARKLKGAIVKLPYPSVGATENIMITATLVKGTTVIQNAAIEPEIVDLAQFLQSMGAIIYQDINRTWVIEGVERLHPADHVVLGDRIEAASFAVAAAVTGGSITVEGCRQSNLMTFLNAYRKVGGEFEIVPDGIRFFADTKNLKPIALETDVHPGFMTDWQQPFVILLTQANGVSVVHETVYEERFGYTRALNEMGAHIQLFNQCLGGKPCRFQNRDFNHSAVIVGKTKLKGHNIDVPDLRAGFSYLIAALLAEGESVLTNVRYIERGYENIASRFQKLGARLEIGEE